MESSYLLKRYLVKRYLGDGAFGDVFEAVDKDTGERVGIKRCRRVVETADPSELPEVQAMKALGSHPNLVTLKYAEIIDKNPHYVLDLMKETLFARIERGKLDEAEIRDLAWQMFQGAAHIHRQGYMHRDLKPGNMLLNNGQLKISDFGTARLYQPAACAAACEYELPEGLFTTSVGTQYYIAPELLRYDEYGPKVDMWAIGCIMAELFTGKILFEGPTKEQQLATIENVFGKPSDNVLAKRKDRLGKLLVSASPQAIDLVARLLDLIPEERPSAERALKKHSFFKPCRESSATIKHRIEMSESQSTKRMKLGDYLMKEC